MKAAKGRVVITPPTGTPMGGNVRKDNKSRGVHDDLYCNILLLDDGRKTICLLGFDLIGLRYITCNLIKKRIEETTAIPASDIVIWSTHTHSGPDTCMQMNEGIEEYIQPYLDDIIERVAEGVAGTSKNFESVTLKTGKTSVPDLSFNRRLIKKDGSVVMNFEEFNIHDITGTTGPIDEELITLSVWDQNNKLIAIMVNFTLHTAILVGYKWLISRDFVHFLDEYIIQNYGKQAVLLFANGAEGNINSLNYKDPYQLKNFEETERIGKKLGAYVSESIEDSSVLHGKIRFVSEKITLPLREITEEEKQWADMVMERDKDLVEDSLHGIPDKTYARMIKSMLVREDKELETVVQGLAIHNFAFVTFPGEVYVEFGLRVKELSPYENTMVIGLANSDSGYIPKREAFAEGGYEVRTAWSSQLVYDAGDILVNIVKEKIIDPLSRQSIKVMERKAADNKYLHKDFHVALNLMMNYIYDNFGDDALRDYLKQFASSFYQPLNQKLRSADTKALKDYMTNIYEKEEWPVKINSGKNYVEIEQHACPGITHIIEKGGKPCPLYRETYETVYKTLCENTPFEYVLNYFNDETGACKQLFILKETEK